MDKKIIAITGGIGSGKSYALNILSSWGYPTFSCDETLKEIYNDEKVLLEVKKAFPKVFDGEILNRKVLANTVFNDNLKLEKLNAITHPHIFNKVISGAKQSDGEIAFIEVPLLLEGGYQRFFDGVIVIKRSISKRIASVKTRSNLTEDEIRKRMSAQVDYDTIDLKGFFVIENTNEESLIAQLKEIINRLK